MHVYGFWGESRSYSTAFSHFSWRLICEFLEHAGEIVGVVKAAKKGDLGDGHIGGAQQLGRLLHADAVLVFLKALACEAFEDVAKIVFIEVRDLGKLLKRNIGLVVVVYEFDRFIEPHDPLRIAVPGALVEALIHVMTTQVRKDQVGVALQGGVRKIVLIFILTDHFLGKV